MKKQMTILQVLIVTLVVTALATFTIARTTGYLYGDALVIGYPGTTVASIDADGDIDGAAVTGDSLALVGSGGVTVSTSSTSGTSLKVMGSVVTLSTRPTSVGQIWYQSSDYKLYVSTAVPAHNSGLYADTAAYAALN